MWGHHPAFGAPFLSPDCRVDLPGRPEVEVHPVPEPTRFAAGTDHVRMDTTVRNLGAAPLDLFMGETLNGSGQVELFQPGYGFGEPLITTPCPPSTWAPCAADTCDGCNFVAYSGEDRAAGVSYGFVNGSNGGTSFTVSGTTVVLFGNQVLLVLTGLATPNFLLALVLMFVSFTYFGVSVAGLFSPELQEAPWGWRKVFDLLEHLWIPVVVIGTAGTAGMIRRLRANLLDELKKQYVVTARAKGVPPRRLLLKYPLRIALNPFISDIGDLLPELISGSVIVSIVMSLPTTGPMLLRALRTQDMYLAGSFLMLMAALTVIGVFLSDLALAALDPRIRQGAERSR